ncbi:MAG: PAS domain-containing protein [Brumimicrobium sp.]
MKSQEKHFKNQNYLNLDIDENFQIVSIKGELDLWKKTSEIKSLPISINLLQSKVKHILLYGISKMELSGIFKLTLDSNFIRMHQLNGFNTITFNLIIKEDKKVFKVSLVNLKESVSDISEFSQLKQKTNSQFKSFFERIEKVNSEIDRRNKVNNELVSLNKQLLLKDQLLERNKNNVEALLNNNLQAFILVDTFYSIQAFNNKAKELFLSISKKTIEKNAFFYDYFNSTNLPSIKEDFKRINKEGDHQFTVNRNYFNETQNKMCSFQVNYTAVLDKKHELRSISIGFLDVTEFIETQKELASSQNLISSVFNTTSMGIMIVNQNGEIKDANTSLCKHIEKTQKQIKKSLITDIFNESLEYKEFPFFDIKKSEQVIEWKSKKIKNNKIFSIRAELLNNTANKKLIVITVRDISTEILMKERLKNITNNVPGTVFRYHQKHDGTDELLYVSEGAFDLWGMDHKSVIDNNQPIWDRYHPDDIYEHKDSISKSKREMSDWYHEWRYLHPTKGLRWHRGVGKPTLLPDKSVAWDSIIIDITEEKKTQHESRKLKEELEIILTQSPDIICTINPNGEFVKVSSASFNVLGYFPDELIGRKFMDFIIKEDIPKTKKIDQKLLKGGSTSNFENKYIHKNGQLVPLIWSARWDDSTNLLYCIARDGSEKKKNEEALKLMNQRYALATKATNEIIWEYEVSNGNLFFTDNFKRVFKFDLPGLSKNFTFYNGLIHPIDRQKVRRSFKNALYKSKRDKWQYKYDIVKTNNEFITVQDSAIIIRDKNNKAIKVVGAIKNITELEKAHKIERFEKIILSKSLQPNTTLSKVTELFAKGIDKILPNSYCSISVIKNNKFSNISAPSLPPEFVKLFNGLEVKPENGACGYAAYHNKTFVSTNISDDKIWKTNADIFKEYNLNSCWSTPVLNSKSEVIGTICIFKSEHKKPSEWETKLIQRFANLFGILIEKHVNEEKLSKSNEVYELVNKASRDAIYELDFEKNHIDWGESYTNIFGYKINKNDDFPLEKWLKNVHPDDQKHVNWSWHKFLASNEIKWSCSYRYKRNNQTYAEVIENGYLIRGKKNKPIRMIGVLRDISEQKQLESLITRSSKLAKIGSWEVDLINDSIYWSPMTREIHEVSEDFVPDTSNTLEDFFIDENKKTIYNAFDNAVNKNHPIDIEIEILTASNTKKWIRINGETELMLGKVVKIFGSIQDIDARKNAELELIEKTKFLTLLSEINQELLNYDHWESVIQKIFKLIGLAIGVDRVYFFKIFNENNVEKLSHRFEWCSKNTFPQIDDPKLLSFKASKIPSVMRAMHKNVPYKAIISNLEESNEKKIFTESEIKSLYNIPIYIKQKLFGILGFDDCMKERDWTDQETAFLTTVTQHISIAYEGHVAELKIIKSKKSRDVILNSIKDGFLSTDNQWKIKYWNGEAEKLTGLNKSDALGTSFWSIFNELPNEIKKRFKSCIKNNKTTIIEHYFKSIDKWLEFNLYPSEEGASLYFKDISDRKVKEQELILSNQRFEKVTEATNDAIWEWDVVNDSLYWGLGYQKQFGHTISNTEINIKEWEKHLHPDDKEIVFKSLKEIVKDPQKTSWTQEYRYQNFDLSYSYVMDRGYIIRDEKGNALRMIGAMTDITHRKEYEESLEYLNAVLKNRAEELTEMNLELERFAYIASHDLQEPLRMVTGFLTQLEKKYADKLDEKANQYIHFAVDGAKRMRKIILDLLQYSKSGRIDEEEITTLNTGEIVEEVVNILDVSIKESNAKITIGKLPKLNGIKLSFTQIFQNLISNALKYKKEDVTPEISIKCTTNDKEYIFSISDNGIGIEPKYHDKIFVIFQRLHNKDSYSGTGVGLAIVKKIVDQIGGKIWVESTKNNGSTFYFSVPIITD